MPSKRPAKKAPAKKATAKKAPVRAPRAKKQAPAKQPAATDVPAVADRRADLERARTLLLAALAGAEVRELPALVRELRAVAMELEQLVPLDEGNVLDEISARRAARLSAANSAGGTRGNQQRG